MPSLTVPEQYANGLEHILTLSPETGKKIAEELEKAQTTDTRELMEHVVLVAPEVSIRHAREFVNTLRSLYVARTSMELNVDSFVREIIRAARQEAPNVTFATAEAEQAASLMLRDLLSVRPLSILSKARGLHTDHENVYCSARIMTDLRPVFDTDVSEDPVGFAMAHVLKLGYHHNGKHTELYVAMDKTDLPFKRV